MKALIKKAGSIAQYLYRNLAKPKILNYRHGATLKRNATLKDAYRGQRCFIMATGPSINNVQLADFRSEHAFVVNDFIKHPDYQKLDPSFYVMADTGFFSSEREDDYFGKRLQMKSEQSSSKTKFFLNLVGKKLIEKRNLFTQQEVYYLSIHGLFSSYFDFNLEIDKTIPYPKNVVLACLLIARYLGFEKIYLLGCEHSFLAQPIRLGQANDISHFYGTNVENPDMNDSQVVQEQGWERSINSGYESEMAHVKQLFKNYRLFYQKAKRLNPKFTVYNATPNSFLDIFPFVDLKNIDLNKK